METILVNDWINLNETRKGAKIQRKYAGLDTLCDPNDKVLYCAIKYWERELYPNGESIKTVLRSYTLTDLERQEWIDTPEVLDEQGTVIEPAIIKFRDELKLLSEFVKNIGNDYIISPARKTIENLKELPLEHEEAYPLHRDTRKINILSDNIKVDDILSDNIRVDKV